MPIESPKMKISKKQNNVFFFLMSLESFNPKIRFLETDGQTHTKVNTDGTLSGFQEFFLQPIIKDRSNKTVWESPKGSFLSVLFIADRCFLNYILRVLRLFFPPIMKRSTQLLARYDIRQGRWSHKHHKVERFTINNHPHHESTYNWQ